MDVPAKVNNKILLEWGLYNYNRLLECNSDKRAIRDIANGEVYGSDKRE